MFRAFRVFRVNDFSFPLKHVKISKQYIVVSRKITMKWLKLAPMGLDPQSSQIGVAVGIPGQARDDISVCFETRPNKNICRRSLFRAFTWFLGM